MHPCRFRAGLLVLLATLVPACQHDAAAPDPGQSVGGPPGELGPIVTILSPGQDSTFNENASIPIRVGLEDAAGIVIRVDFYHDGIPIGSSLNFPFSITWKAPSPGTYVLMVIATDQNGLSASAEPVVIRVRQPTLPSSSSREIRPPRHPSACTARFPAGSPGNFATTPIVNSSDWNRR